MSTSGHHHYLQVTARLKHLLRSLYFTLYYHQQVVAQFGIYHDRKVFSRLQQNLERYALHQYHQTTRVVGKVHHHHHRPLQSSPESAAAYPSSISANPGHLLLMKCFMTAVLVRCLLIAFLPQLVAGTLEQRILLGTAFWGPDDFRYLETALFLWTAIVCCTLQFTLSSDPLDYQSLAIFTMSSKLKDVSSKSAFFDHVNFGLTEVQFTRFAAFRRRALVAYHAIIGGILSLVPVVIGGIAVQSGLLVSWPLTSLFWTAVIVLISGSICTVIYGNLVAFTVVARYLVVKQLGIADQLTRTLVRLQISTKQPSGSGFSTLWTRFLLFSTRHAHLNEELADYCAGLWTSYLSFVFAFYVLLITFMLYIVLLSGLAFYIRGIMLMGLVAHIGLLVVIIASCGSLVKRNECLARRFAETVGGLGKGLNWKRKQQPPLTKAHFLKVSNMATAATLCAAQSGVQLLNCYLVRYDTFRLLVVNITMFFILFNKK